MDCPWVDPLDRVPQGDPETVAWLPKRGTLVGLHIKGLSEHVMLGIREDVQGQPVSCAITNELDIDTMTVQSNPRRIAERPTDYGEA